MINAVRAIVKLCCLPKGQSIVAEVADVGGLVEPYVEEAAAGDFRLDDAFD